MNIDRYLTYDLPIPYKTLLINPIRMDKYLEFYDSVICLLLDKNSVPDIKVISMGYLTYLLSLGCEEPFFLVALDNLLRMSLTVEKTYEDGTIAIEKLTEQDDIKFSKDLKSLFIKGDIFDSEDFDIVKSIICKQNQIEMIDETISKEVRDAIAESEKFKQRQRDSKVCSIEDQLISIGISTGYSLEYLYTITIRKFIKMIERIDHTLHYKIYLAGIMSGNMKMKDGAPLKHWMADLEDVDKHKDSKLALDDLKGKLGDKGDDADEPKDTNNI